MSTGFQQQKPLQHLGFTRSVVQPQHGHAPPASAAKLKEPRSFQPRPGH